MEQHLLSHSQKLIPSELTVIGIDIGRDIFHPAGFDLEGTIVLLRKIRRLALTATFEKLPRCIIGVEACLSAQFGGS